MYYVYHGLLRTFSGLRYLELRRPSTIWERKSISLLLRSGGRGTARLRIIGTKRWHFLWGEGGFLPPAGTVLQRTPPRLPQSLADGKNNKNYHSYYILLSKYPLLHSLTDS